LPEYGTYTRLEQGRERRSSPQVDVLAANDLTRALYSPFARLDNLARMAFLDPVARHVHIHWESTAESVVGHLREAAGPDPDHPRLRVGLSGDPVSVLTACAVLLAMATAFAALASMCLRGRSGRVVGL